MIYLQKPLNFETESGGYLVIGYYREKAIVKDEAGTLYFLRCEENEAPIGTVVTEQGLEPIEKLSEEEQEAIEEIYRED